MDQRKSVEIIEKIPRSAIWNTLNDTLTGIRMDHCASHCSLFTDDRQTILSGTPPPPPPRTPDDATLNLNPSPVSPRFSLSDHVGET